MSIQGFRGNCDSKGKLGMCPSLAEPDSGGFPRTSRRQLKSFLLQQFFKNAGEVWASSPHLRSKLYLQQVFPAAIAFLNLQIQNLIIFMK